MLHSASFHYDASSALSLGQREQQEDAIVADFPIGAGMGFAVLSDGMGGHAAGDVASKIVVTEVFSELKLLASNPDTLECNIDAVLRDAAVSANECVRYHSDTCPTANGMGATLVAPVIIKNRLYWVSVGDSPLFLFRQGVLRRLNEDHSLTAQLDYLVGEGLMKLEDAQNHPDRSCLTSVLAGQPIQQIDCPDSPIELMHDDIIIAASDGLQFLTDERIEELVRENTEKSSGEISTALLQDLNDLNDPGQDNTSLCIVKIQDHVPDVLAPAETLEPANRQISDGSWRKPHTTVAAMTKSKSDNFYRLVVERSV